MSKARKAGLSHAHPENECYFIGVGKLVDYALDPHKADRFHRNFKVRLRAENPQSAKIRQTLVNLMHKETLNGYVSNVWKSRTYLHYEGRCQLGRSVRMSGLVHDKVRRKVS